MRGITDADYRHTKRGWKNFEIKKRKKKGKCHDLYVWIDTVLLARVFENFRSICLGIFKFGPACFVIAPG